MSLKKSDILWQQRHPVLYRVELSILYHQKRERFFEICDKLAKAVAVIGGSAAWAKLGLEVAAPLITVTSTMSLVFNLSERSKRHSELSRNFRQLEAEIVLKGEDGFDQNDINIWASKVRSLESSEPPALSTLVRICQNELAIASGQPEKVVEICCIKRLLAHFFDFTTSP